MNMSANHSGMLLRKRLGVKNGKGRGLEHPSAFIRYSDSLGGSNES